MDDGSNTPSAPEDGTAPTPTKSSRAKRPTARSKSRSPRRKNTGTPQAGQTSASVSSGQKQDSQPALELDALASDPLAPLADQAELQKGNDPGDAAGQAGDDAAIRNERLSGVSSGSEQTLPKARPWIRSFQRISALPRLNIRDNKEKYAYVGALIGGSIIIAAGKGFGFLNAWVAVIIATLIIIAYATFAALNRNYRVRLDRAGDNCYYLGLTYTLISMFIALIKLEPGMSPDALIEAFGIALGSTIVGIISRLVLIQFHSESDDIEARARIDLAVASERLKHQLDHASSRFQAFAFSIQESVRASVVGITDEQLGKQQALIEQFSGLLEKSVTAISKAGDGFESSMGRHAEIAERFDDAAKRSVDAAQALAEKVENVNIPKDLITRGFGDVARELHASADALKASIAEVQGATRMVGEASGHLDTFASRTKMALDSVDGFATSAQSLSTSMDTLIKSVDTSSADLGEKNAALGAELGRLKELSLSYATSLAEVADFLAREIGGRASRT